MSKKTSILGNTSRNEPGWEAKAYAEFVQNPIPEVLSQYEFPADMILVDIFALRPIMESALILPDAMTDTEKGFMWMPIAKVMSGETEMIKKGDIVRISDFKVLVYANPKYEEWNTLKNNPTITKLGEAPPKYTTKFFESFMRYSFALSPIPNEVISETLRLFLIPKFEIIAKIKDPYVIFS